MKTIASGTRDLISAKHQHLMRTVTSEHTCVVSTREAVEGGVTENQLRKAQAARITRGVYLRDGSWDDFRVKAEAALAASGEGAALCAQSALLHRGVELPHAAHRDRKVHVLLGRGQRGARPPWIQAHRPRLVPAVQVHDGLPIVVPGDAWMEMACSLTVTDLVMAGDGLVRRQNPIMTMQSLGETILSWRGRRGYERAGQAFGLIRPRTDSPPETHLRLVLLGAGLDGLVVNHQVRTPWGSYYLDLAYVKERVAVEYDGAIHVGDVRQMERDQTRRRWLEDQGWRIITVTMADLNRDRAGVIASVHRALDVAARAR